MKASHLSYLERIMKERSVTGKELASLLSLSPSNITRRLDGTKAFSYSELILVDNFLGEEGRILSLAHYPVGTGSRRAEVDLSLKIALSLSPQMWIDYFESRLRAVDNPAGDAQLSHVFGEQLEIAFRTTPSKNQKDDLKTAVAMARLAESWALLNSVRRTDLRQPVALANSVAELYPDREVQVLASYISNAGSRMLHGHVTGIDNLEKISSLTSAVRPIIAGFFFEELAKQAILSDDHTMENVQQYVQYSAANYSKDRRLQGKVIGLNAVTARSIWIKGHDPRAAADLMHEVLVDLESGPYSEPDLIIIANAFEAIMRQEAGQNSYREIMKKAYLLASMFNNEYFVELIKDRALMGGVDVIEYADDAQHHEEIP